MYSKLDACALLAAEFITAVTTMTRRKRPNALSFLDDREQRQLKELLDYLDLEVPGPFRTTLLAHLLGRVVPLPLASLGYPRQSLSGPLFENRVDLACFVACFSQRGNVLLKSLAALHLGEVRLGVHWMTPRELATLISSTAAGTTPYRSNVSNMLRRETTLVTRRRRGRGFEYALTDRGRKLVDHHLRLLQRMDNVDNVPG
ncbi:MAG: hypothetical protein ACE5HV_06715 [Acidobacteriota bacterium]